MDEHLQCTYIGHTTAILRLGASHIITDPHFGKRVLLSKRRQELPIDPGRLPDLACVLLSHTHMDHLHLSSYKYISCGVPIILPEGRERAVGKFLSNPVIELSHYATHELACGTHITAVPAMHNCFPWLRTPGTNAYLVRPPESELTIFFCGDSAYGPHFREIWNLGRIDLALLPIGGYEPAWPMRRVHMTPAEAVAAFEDLRAEHMIPIHHGTFRLSMENIDAPILWLKRIIEERPDLAARIHPLEPGQTFARDAARTETAEEVA